MPIHRCYPPTAQHETFCLLLFSPGPVQFSLCNLDISDSSEAPMLMLDLERTPDQHRTPATRIPDLKPSNNSSSGSSSHSHTRPWPAGIHRANFWFSTKEWSECGGCGCGQYFTFDLYITHVASIQCNGEVTFLLMDKPTGSKDNIKVKGTVARLASV